MTDTTTEWVKDFFRELNGTGFYGKVTLSFEAGRVTTVKKEETLKPPTDRQERNFPRQKNFRG